MSKAVEAIDEKSFDVSKINADIEQIIFADPAFNPSDYENKNQISLRQSDDWMSGTGSLFDYTKMQWGSTTDEYAQPAEKLKGSYLESVISDVEKCAQEHGVKIGRIRIMRMKGKTCLTLHVDPDEFRFHIPLKTSYKSMFIVGTEVLRMPEVGQLYKFATNIEHTAVNASFEDRVHIVFDTFR